MEMSVKLSHPESKVPKHSRDGDAGLDISVIEHEIIAPGEVRKIRSGVHVEIPEGHFGLLLGRSSTVARGLQVGPAIIDSNYRGEVVMCTANNSSRVQEFYTGDRIAQLVVIPYVSITAMVKDELSASQRGDSGFGSSGR